MIKIGDLTFNNSPDESFNAIILDTVYIFRQKWNTLGFWTLDIADEDGNMITAGVKIVSGSFILAQFPSISFDLCNPTQVDPTRQGISDYILGVYQK